MIQNQQLQQRTAPVVQQVVAAAAVPTLRNFEKEKSQHLVEHQINEKMIDNHKLLLESLSNLPQNILQSWIQSGQLQVSMDEGNINNIIRCTIVYNWLSFLFNRWHKSMYLNTICSAT